MDSVMSCGETAIISSKDFSTFAIFKAMSRFFLVYRGALMTKTDLTFKLCRFCSSFLLLL